MLLQCRKPNITVWLCGPVILEQCTQKLIFSQAVITIRGGRWSPLGPSRRCLLGMLIWWAAALSWTVGSMLINWSASSHPCGNVSASYNVTVSDHGLYDCSGEGCDSWVTGLCNTFMPAPIYLPSQHANYHLTFLCSIDIIIYIINHGVSSYYILWTI